MSDTKKPKRLAKTTAPTVTNTHILQADAQLYIMPYTPKSIVVMGETLNHSNALASLGGKYMELRIGSGWLFAKFREESVKNYIDTGEIVPYVYSDADRAKFDNTKKAISTTDTASGIDSQQLRKMFCEFREAFEPTEDYEGKAIIDVIYQLEEKYFPAKGNVIKAASKQSPGVEDHTAPKRLARKNMDSGGDEYVAPPTKRLARKNVDSGGDEYVAPPTKRLARKNVGKDEYVAPPKRLASKIAVKTAPVRPPPITTDSDSEAEMESDSDSEAEMESDSD